MTTIAYKHKDKQVVPCITRIDDSKVGWFSVFYYFMVAHKYLYKGLFYPAEGRRKLLKGDSINGFYLATVNSRTYTSKDDVTHMVVIDRNFNVIHDPHPNKKWQDECLWGDKDFKSVYKFRKMNKTDMNYWYYI